MEMTTALRGLEVGGIADLPGPGKLEGWPVFERNGRSVAILGGRFGDDIHGPTQWTGS
jgi:hypothetical protein